MVLPKNVDNNQPNIQKRTVHLSFWTEPHRENTTFRRRRVVKLFSIHIKMPNWLILFITPLLFLGLTNIYLPQQTKPLKHFPAITYFDVSLWPNTLSRWYIWDILAERLKNKPQSWWTNKKKTLYKTKTTIKMLKYIFLLQNTRENKNEIVAVTKQLFVLKTLCISFCYFLSANWMKGLKGHFN